MSSSAISPGDFLKQAVGKQVRVRLNNGTDFLGNMKCLYGFLNIAMENTLEYDGEDFKKSYGDSFVRGNNVVYITVSSEAKRE
jgi:U6 snRNA-associated Sm-like protein LSm6